MDNPLYQTRDRQPLDDREGEARAELDGLAAWVAEELNHLPRHQWDGFVREVCIELTRRHRVGERKGTAQHE